MSARALACACAVVLLPATAAAAGHGGRQLSRATERPYLQRFYEATRGASWQRNSKWLGAEEACVGAPPFYPTPNWHGIQVCIMGEVQRLVLKADGLRGTLPTEVGGLTALTSMLQLSR